MSWASKRSTSRVEDAAYSLMGLFNVFMPMLYGEGDRAFIRLQEAIMKQSEDYTIFAWQSTRPETQQRGLFAKSPAEFQSIVHKGKKQAIAQYLTPLDEIPIPAALTSRGLYIALPLFRMEAVEEPAPGAQDISLPSQGSFNLFRHTPSPGMYMALICHVIPVDESNHQLLCIWLRMRNVRGIFTRAFTQSVAIVPKQQAALFTMQNIYAQSATSMSI